MVFKAIGGAIGGSQIDDSIFPVQYVIDYIRVYKPSMETFPEFNIKAKANNQYVSAENAGKSPLIANRLNTAGNLS